MDTIPANDMVDTSSLLRCYVLLGLGLPMTFMPLGFLSGFGLLMLVIGVIWAYRLRKREGELFANHSRWMIRTFWISSLYFLIAMMLSGAIISGNSDATAIEQLNALMAENAASPEQINALMFEFQATNHDLILVTTLVCFVPAVFHSVARYGIGYHRAWKGLPIEKVTTWLIR